MEFIKTLLLQLAAVAVGMAAAFLLVVAPIIWRDWGWLLFLPGLPVGALAVFLFRELYS